MQNRELLEIMVNGAAHTTIANFIWNIADDVLRDVYVRGKYRDVILPMTVIRRLDCLLEPTKEDILKQKRLLDDAGIMNQDAALRQSSKQAFYNTSKFTLKSLLNTPKQLVANFKDYLDGFSPNVQEIIEKFDFRNQLKKLDDADALGHLIDKFVSPSINLSPQPVLNGKGEIDKPGLSNHDMGYVFEELIRRFSEENNEEAGEHFTPREVVSLMATLIFRPVAEKIGSGTYLVYDCACGTGGMLTVSDEVLTGMAQGQKKEVSIHLYGQEINAETYAICKADLLLKGEGDEADNIKFGSTLSNDSFPSTRFDFMLANPPYGKSWKTDLDRLCGGDKKEMLDLRFVVNHGEDPEFPLVTRSSDGQLMFLVNMLSKMKHDSSMGSRVATIHNGSSLFTGDAGQGESNIRRWIIENDWLEAIIALPLNMFYNTGIATYIWVLSNRKPDHRKGKVQLIDATEWFRPLRKNLGKKNCELASEHIKLILDTFMNFEDNEKSKVFSNEAFGYWKITVERPLRLRVDLTVERLEEFKAACAKDNEVKFCEMLLSELVDMLGEGPHMDFNKFMEAVKAVAKEYDLKLTAKRKKLLSGVLAAKDGDAAEVVKKRHKDGTIEYEPDSELRDTEQVPFLEEGGIQAFFEREVLPHAPDAWIDHDKTLIGYEVSFARYFYKPQPLRTLEEIKADILALGQESEGLLDAIIGERAEL